jgi:hypothetical protein
MLTGRNITLSKQNAQLQDDITDLRCRSVTDNMVILGISEHLKLLQDSIGGAPLGLIHPLPEPTEVEEKWKENIATYDGHNSKLICRGCCFRKLL